MSKNITCRMILYIDMCENLFTFLKTLVTIMFLYFLGFHVHFCRFHNSDLIYFINNSYRGLVDICKGSVFVDFVYTPYPRIDFLKEL